MVRPAWRASGSNWSPLALLPRVNVLAAADAVAFVLEVAVTAHENLVRNASVRDGEISDPRGRDGFPLSRPGQHMSLDQLSKYADRQNAISAQLRRQSDLCGALGVSKSTLEAERLVSKSRGQGLPSDSYTGSHEPLAAKLMRRP